MNDKNHESQFSTEPRYRIQMVADLTGMSSANLRAWERRYGIPQPQRDENSYRLYSRRDITLLQKMKLFYDQGHAPSVAAKLAQELLRNEQKKPSQSPIQLERSFDQHYLVEQLIAAAKKFDQVQLERIIEHCLQTGSAWYIYQNIFEPTLRQIGYMWESDHSYVAHEHLLSHSIKDALQRLLRLIAPPSPHKRILFACICNELHDIPLIALALRASHAGCLPILLGANTPPMAIKSALKHYPNIDLIVLSATSAYDLYYGDQTDQQSIQDLKQILQEYNQACEGYRCLIGGRATQSWSYLPLEDYNLKITSDYQVLDQMIYQNIGQ